MAAAEYLDQQTHDSEREDSNPRRTDQGEATSPRDRSHTAAVMDTDKA